MKTNTYFVFNCNVPALFTFYALPSGGKLKGVVVHSLSFYICLYLSLFYHSDFFILISLHFYCDLWVENSVNFFVVVVQMKSRKFNFKVGDFEISLERTWQRFSLIEKLKVKLYLKYFLDFNHKERHRPSPASFSLCFRLRNK